jgi:hypothetical protein
MTCANPDGLREQLDSLDAAVRRGALERLARALREGERPAVRPEVNLHCHTFFSYNGYGYSPSRFAYEAAAYGLAVAGIVDFDVLDGVREFLKAGRLLGLKTTAGFESRVFVPEYRDRVINSPHEPGVYYLVGTGFTCPPEPGTAGAGTLQQMADCARGRNLVMVEKINAYLDPVTIDYETDVLPLTPAGNATERHMLVAYEARAREAFPGMDELAAFWSGKLGDPLEKVRALLDDVPEFMNLVRSRLMKHGGVGYAPPEEGSFPLLDDVVAMTLECGAVPSGCWLDGTNSGEADPLKHFSFLREKGIPTLTVIPDRNWDIKDPAEREVKVRNLHAALEAARRLKMPVFVGTEMNKFGLKFVDGFDAPALEPYQQLFLDSAGLAWGHTLLKMTAGVGYTGEWADEQFGQDRDGRNAFFTRVGRAPYPGAKAMTELIALGPGAGPRELLSVLGP